MILYDSFLGDARVCKARAFIPEHHPVLFKCDLGNGTACFKKCKHLFEYQHLLLLTEIWWSKL
jgi:hypothetical protein